MKTTITLRDGRFTIEMKPENDFEKTLIEDAERESNKFEIHTMFSTSNMQTNHSITITGIKREKIMPTYKCSDGTRVTQAQIDRNIRKAKIQLISNCKEEYGYVFCQKCRQNDCKPVDCSHNKSVQECKNEGKTELCWDLDNMKLRGRNCHKIKDGLNLQFNKVGGL